MVSTNMLSCPKMTSVMPPCDFNAEDMVLLQALLGALPEKGLSWQTVLDVSPSLLVAISAIPSAEAGLFDFIKRGCVHTITQQAQVIAAPQKTRDRVTEGGMAFLNLFAAAPAAASVLMVAHPVGFHGILWAVADEIWHHAGDTSTDHNYYTKRALLSQILLHAVLLMTGAGAYHAAEMRAFLQRDIARVFAMMRPFSAIKTFFSSGMGAAFPPLKKT